MMNKKELLHTLLCSVLLAVFSVPTLFLGQIMSYIYDVLPFVYCALMAILYALMIKSDKMLKILIKWGISLPVSYLLFLYFWKTNYAVRALNWIFEGYGNMSAGGGFAFLFYLGVFCVFYAISVLLSVCWVYPIKALNYNKLRKLQLCVGPAVGITVIAVTLILESRFPTYSSIFFTG